MAEGAGGATIAHMDATVVVATTAHRHTLEHALHAAIPSAQAERVPVVHARAATLHEARTAGLRAVRTEWVCFLDAGDEIEPGFFEALSAASGELRAPAVRPVRRGVERARARVPRVPGHGHPCEGSCLRRGNWLPLATLAPTELVRSVGGWRDVGPEQDWDLWVRCHLAGARVATVPAAVCRSRPEDRRPSRSERGEAEWTVRGAGTTPRAVAS